MNKGNRQRSRHNGSRFVCGLVSFLVTLSVCWAAETNFFFYTSRYQPQTFNLGSPATVFQLVSAAGSFTDIVKAPTNVVILTNETFATEYEGMAWGYPTAIAAWTAAVSCYSSHYMVYSNVVYDNVGWITGTREAYETWGAFVWLMQDTISFYSSTSSLYISPNGATSEIACVIVGSLGVYNPQTHVTEVGPILPTNYMGEGVSTDAVFKADLSTYYRIVPKFKWNVNDDDIDHDGIPGFADGFNWDGTSGNDDDRTPDAFHTWNLFLYNACEPTQATVRLTYSSSDPASVSLNGSNYTAAAGAFRLWKKNGAQLRNKNSFVAGSPGDFVPPGVYSARDFGFTNRSQTLKLYIEPVNTSSTNEVILFEVDADGPNGPKGYVSYAKIGGSLLRIELLHDILGDLQELDDWPQQGTQLRSPKFLFGKEDNVFVRINGPSGLGNNYFKVKVTSQSDTTGVDLDLREVSSGVYINSEDDDELLRLADTTAEDAPADTIKVVEEEGLRFKVFANAVDTGCSRDVVVDRGEYSAAGDANWPGDTQKFRSEMQNSRVNWFEAGYNDALGPATIAAFRAFIKAAGAATASHGEADMLYYTAHGDYDGTLYAHPPSYASVIFDGYGIANSSDWNDDLEWFYSDACSSLHNASEQGSLTGQSVNGYLGWTDALFGSPRPAHMVLGHWAPVNDPWSWKGWGNSQAICDDFFDHAADSSPDTIIISWLHANTDMFADQECAVVAHADNVDDQLKVVTRDSSSTAMKYYWYDPTGIGGTWHDTDFTKTLPSPARAEVEIPDITPIVHSLNLTRRRVISDEALRTCRRSRAIRHGTVSLLLNRTETRAVADSTSAWEYVSASVVTSAPLSGLSKAYIGSFNEGDFSLGDSHFCTPPKTIGQLYKWVHEVDGKLLYGDEVSLLVLNGRPEKIRACWHDVAQPQGREQTNAISPRVLEPLVRQIMSREDPPFQRITKVDLGYYAFHEAGKSRKNALPVWLFCIENETHKRTLYFDAITGKQLDSQRDMARSSESEE